MPNDLWNYKFGGNYKITLRKIRGPQIYQDIFERLINNRIKDEIRMTEAQAGGQAGKSTADHINILNSIINHSKRKKKQNLYIAFLDVTKAYDKAWLNAIMYTVHKNGLEGKYWKIVKELNSNLTAKVRTKYGLTRTIQIRDSIRQGGVLSVIARVCQPDG